MRSGAHWRSGWRAVRPQHSELPKAVDFNHVFPKGIITPLEHLFMGGGKTLKYYNGVYPFKGS